MFIAITDPEAEFDAVDDLDGCSYDTVTCAYATLLEHFGEPLEVEEEKISLRWVLRHKSKPQIIAMIHDLFDEDEEDSAKARARQMSKGPQEWTIVSEGIELDEFKAYLLALDAPTK